MNDEDLQFEEIDVSHVSAMASLRGWKEKKERKKNRR
jgi:hypothetical protein